MRPQAYKFSNDLGLSAGDFQAAGNLSDVADCTYQPLNSFALVCNLTGPALRLLRANVYLQFRVSLDNGTNPNPGPDFVVFWGPESAMPPTLSVISGYTGDSVTLPPYFMRSMVVNSIPNAGAGLNGSDPTVVAGGPAVSSGVVIGASIASAAVLGMCGLGVALGRHVLKPGTGALSKRRIYTTDAITVKGKKSSGVAPDDSAPGEPTTDSTRGEEPSSGPNAEGVKVAKVFPRQGSSDSVQAGEDAAVSPVDPPPTLATIAIPSPPPRPARRTVDTASGVAASPSPSADLAARQVKGGLARPRGRRTPTH